MTVIALVILFVLIAGLPLFVKPIEHQIEAFLLATGLLAVVISQPLNFPNIQKMLFEIFGNQFLYFITVAVLVISLLFRLLESHVKRFVDFLLDRMPLKLIVFLLVVVLGLLSSVITAIIASLLLVEIVSILPIDNKNTVRVSILACFSIGLGAVLTPIGEPLATIVTSKLHQHFLYMIDILGVHILVGVLLLGLISIFFVDNKWREGYNKAEAQVLIPEKEDTKTILIRTGKIFMFVVALDLLGLGFKPVIDTYIIHWSNNLLYAVNMVSAILDNATLAAAEIGIGMTTVQIKIILVSLLVSGGMLVTGNIPNIITAAKLKISMKQWAIVGLPVGAVFLVGYYIVLFVLHI